MAPNLSVPFGVSGGTAPYTWSVVPGGAGGSINASTGEYTSPSGIGVDVIQVVDSVAASAQYSMTVGYPLMLVCDIIQTSMGLSNGQVYLWDQKINIPTDSQLYVAVGVNYCTPFGNRTRYNSSGGVNEVQSVNMLANLSIDILSRGPAARDMKEQVLLAFSSTYAEQQMELNSFFIAPISTDFVNISEIDGAAIPYRFNISANLQYFSTKTNPVSYFDTFTNPPAVTTES
jgi:hypothetical protein